MAGLFDLMRGLRGAPADPARLAEIQRAMQWQKSVMYALSKDQMSPEEKQADRAAQWYAAAGYTPADLGRGLRGLWSSPTQISKAQEWAALAPIGATVFHGSPHRFEKFDLSKIGTGEGAQAYGHGLYFAENPKVAGSYRSVGADPMIDGSTVSAWTRGDLKKGTIGELASYIDSYHDPASIRMTLQNRRPDLLKLHDEMVATGRLQYPSGNLYKVDLPDDQIAKMLDWDKSLSQQSEAVKKALKESGITDNIQAWMRGNGIPEWRADPEGRELLSFLGKGNPAEASAKLREIGIPGIRYLDQGSRAGGKGTSNFVVFDPELLKILERE